MPGIVRSSYHGVRPVDDDRDRAQLAAAIREHARNLDVKAMAPQITYRDDVPSPPGVPIDASSPFAYVQQIEDGRAALYVVEGWFDAGFGNGAIRRYLTLKSRGRLIIGPWNHGGFNDASPFSHSPKSAFKIDAELLRFFDYHLKGMHSGVAEEKPILYHSRLHVRHLSRRGLAKADSILKVSIRCISSQTRCQPDIPASLRA